MFFTSWNDVFDVRWPNNTLFAEQSYWNTPTDITLCNVLFLMPSQRHERSPNAVWHKKKCFCSSIDPWVYTSDYQTQADFSAKWHLGTEVCIKAYALGSSPTWEEEKMLHGLTLNPRHELSSDVMTDIARFSSPSLSLFSFSLHWSVWNPNHMHLSSTNCLSSRQIEMANDK